MEQIYFIVANDRVTTAPQFRIEQVLLLGIGSNRKICPIRQFIGCESERRISQLTFGKTASELVPILLDPGWLLRRENGLDGTSEKRAVLGIPERLPSKR